MIISHKYRFIFIKTRKTAGTSIEVLLSSLCDDKDVCTPIYPPELGHVARNYKGRWPLSAELSRQRTGYNVKSATDWIKGRRFRNHSGAQDVKHRVGADIWRSYTTFCVDRNPWDKTLSHFHMCLRGSNPPGSFTDYLANTALCLNYPLYSDAQGQVMVDRVLRYENLNAELFELLSELGVPCAGARLVNAKGNYRKESTASSSASILNGPLHLKLHCWVTNFRRITCISVQFTQHNSSLHFILSRQMGVSGIIPTSIKTKTRSSFDSGDK